MRTSLAEAVETNSSASLIELLNARLADAIDLKLAVKQAHWNLRGPDFIALHEFLDQIAARMDEHADLIAERVVQICGIAVGTTQAVMKKTAIKPYPVGAMAQAAHLEALGERMAAFAENCRAAIAEAEVARDAVTADIMTEVARAVDKDLWLVSAHLE